MTAIVDSIRIGKVFYHNDFKFRMDKTYKESTYWKCATEGCSARLTTIEFTSTVTRETNQHNHDLKSSLESYTFISNLKKNVHLEPSVPVRQLYNNQLLKVKSDKFIPPLDSVSATLNRIQHIYLPKNPSSTDQIQIDSSNEITHDGRQFFQGKLDNGSIIFFIV